ncbi:hypothetical protein OH784_14035 [Ectobacillus funiculus]|uniref:MurR/RpiR family transcriptional regulator n=1 Tax=Ectobacillus funiculus TaxID=137993 RepID=UPI00397E31A0
MSNLIFDITSDKYQTLSESERYLLEYIYRNMEHIPTMSIVRLSEEANVSTATIVRLMKKIGHEGFTSFKYNMRDKLKTSDSIEAIDEIDMNIKQAIKKNEVEVFSRKIKKIYDQFNGFPFEVQTLQITSHFLSLISMQFSMEFSE